MVFSNSILLLLVLLQSTYSFAIVPRRHDSFVSSTQYPKQRQRQVALYGWLDAFLPAPLDGNDNDKKRQEQYPEQYPATYEMSTCQLPEDTSNPEIQLVVRPLLKSTQLETRPLQLAYDANVHGWNAYAFHECVDGKGAAVIVATTTVGQQAQQQDEMIVGGYNPKGWAGLGGARPSVAAFLFYQTPNSDNSKDEIQFQKLQKVGGGGLACCKDEPNYGISLGADGLVIPLLGSGGEEEEDTERIAISKLGPYYECRPDNDERSSKNQSTSLFSNGASAVKLSSLKVYVGIYQDEEEIPYSGAVLDMTSG